MAGDKVRDCACKLCRRQIQSLLEGSKLCLPEFGSKLCLQIQSQLRAMHCLALCRLLLFLAIGHKKGKKQDLKKERNAIFRVNSMKRCQFLLNNAQVVHGARTLWAAGEPATGLATGLVRTGR